MDMEYIYFGGFAPTCSRTTRGVTFAGAPFAAPAAGPPAIVAPD